MGFIRAASWSIIGAAAQGPLGDMILCGRSPGCADALQTTPARGFQESLKSCESPESIRTPEEFPRGATGAGAPSSSEKEAKKSAAWGQQLSYGEPDPPEEAGAINSSVGV